MSEFVKEKCPEYCKLNDDDDNDDDFFGRVVHCVSKKFTPMTFMITM